MKKNERLTVDFSRAVEDKLRLLLDTGIISNISDFVEAAVEEKIEATKKPKNKRFVPPEIDEVFMHLCEVIKSKYPDLSEQGAQRAIEFCKNEAEKYWNFYESKNWYVGKNKMKKWKAAATNWINKAIEDANSKPNNQKRQLNEDVKKGSFYKNL